MFPPSVDIADGKPSLNLIVRSPHRNRDRKEQECMKFKELLYKYNWDDIQFTLLQLYPDQERNIDGYRQVFETLQTITPVGEVSATSPMRICIESAFDEDKGEYYASVSGKDGTLMKEQKDIPPEVLKDDDIGNQEVSYAIEFTDWAERLGMEKDPETQSNYSEVGILGHCLREMTFCGYTREDIKRAMDEIEQISKSDERLTLAQVEQELGLYNETEDEETTD